MVGNGNSNGNLPHDIMINILKRLPVKSLIRFKCVSKDWSHLFQTPHFTAQHLHHSIHNNPFLLLQRIPQSSSCLIGPDFEVHNPQFIDFPSPKAKIIGSCNGLLCVRDTDHHTLSILNPATKEVRQVPPGTLIEKSFSYFGFGFSPAINDYKIVRISVSEFDDRIVDLDNLCVSRAEVYSLATGGSCWKEIDASNLQTVCLMSNSVTANGVIFWQAATRDTDPEVVASFDIGREMFTLLKGPPPPYPNTHSRTNVLAVYNNKLATFHHFIIGSFESSSIDLWVLEEESWVKQYTVGPLLKVLYPLSIWRDEIVCREQLSLGNIDDDEYIGVETVLSVFNPYSNELKKLPAQRDEHYYVSFNYAESLVPVSNIHHQH